MARRTILGVRLSCPSWPSALASSLSARCRALAFHPGASLHAADAAAVVFLLYHVFADDDPSPAARLFERAYSGLAPRPRKPFSHAAALPLFRPSPASC